MITVATLLHSCYVSLCISSQIILPYKGVEYKDQAGANELTDETYELLKKYIFKDSYYNYYL